MTSTCSRCRNTEPGIRRSFPLSVSQWARRQRKLPINTTNAVPSHLYGVEERGQASAHADFRARDIVPTDGDLQGPITEVLGDVEHFHVEAETIQGLPAENLARSGALEQLETALRVMEWEAGDHAHREIEEFTHDFAEPRLTDADQGAVERAGADSALRVFLFDGAPEPIQLLNRRREVGVRQERPIAFSVEHAPADRIAFAAIAGIVEHPGAGSAGDVGGLIARPIIYDNDFGKLPPRLFEVAPDARERSR
jgi:hypothetical protein